MGKCHSIKRVHPKQTVQQLSSVKIHVIVIGQGDAILLETEGRLLQQYNYQQPA